MNKLVYKIYHANLAFSAIPEEQLEDVIDQCYFPLLNLIDKTQTKIGIEISGYSLEIISKLRPLWIEKFKALHNKKLIELIGSGYMQIIGPLVPYKVNLKNQQIGLDVYKNLLGIKPEIVFVNEQTFSSSLVDLYHEVGYKGIIMEWNNAYSVNKSIKKRDAYSPVILKGIKKELPLLWSDSILFQKFQRTIHGERELDYYLEFLRKYTKNYKTIPVYSSDLEIFNFRPGRFETEETISNDEWLIIENIISALKKDYKFELPFDVISQSLNPKRIITLTTDSNLIIVKKQDKYSLSRWAACGRGANYINTLCYNYFKKIKNSNDLENWKILLKYWGSDYRTHITIEKWDKAIIELNTLVKGISPKEFDKKIYNKYFTEVNNELVFEKDKLKIVFNRKKGLTLDSIYLNNVKSFVCTVHHGELDLIKHGADFFTGTTIIESVDTKKIADLAYVEDIEYYELNSTTFEVRALIDLKDGFKECKSWIIDTKHNTIIFDLKLKIPFFIKGSIRAGVLTLDKNFVSKNGKIKIKNGGKNYEILKLKNNELNHHSSKSLLQSSRSGIGCSNGIIKLENDESSITLEIDKTISNPYIMVQNNKDKKGYLTRLYFSLQELDDTLKNHQSSRSYLLRYKIKI